MASYNDKGTVFTSFFIREATENHVPKIQYTPCITKHKYLQYLRRNWISDTTVIFVKCPLI